MSVETTSVKPNRRLWNALSGFPLLVGLLLVVAWFITLAQPPEFARFVLAFFGMTLSILGSILWVKRPAGLYGDQELPMLIPQTVQEENEF